MSKQKKKVSDWVECESCSSAFPRKEVPSHACDGRGTAEAQAGFVDLKRKILFGDVQPLSRPATRGLSMEDAVFVSFDALKLLSIPLSTLVTVERDLVRRIWPSQSLQFCQISFPSPCPVECAGKKFVTIAARQHPPLKLKCISLKPTASSHRMPAAFEENGLIKDLIRALYLSPGKCVQVRALGRLFSFDIVDYQVRDSAEKLEESAVVDVNSFLENEQAEWLTLDSTEDDEEVGKGDGKCLDAEKVVFCIDEQTDVRFIKESKLEPKNWFHRPVLKFNDICGMNAVKAELLDVLRTLSEYRSSSASAPRRIPPSGILIFGPSGVGKSLLRRSLEGDLSIPVVSVLGHDVLSKFMGETEQKIVAKFDEAASQAPSIIWIEDLDLLVSSSGSQKDFERRILSTLLHLLDGAASQGVVVIAATNAVDSIPPSLRRSGRLEREIEIPVPSLKDRVAILRSFGIPDDRAKSVAELTPGFVGGDLETLLRSARRKGESLVPYDESFLSALKEVKPSALKEVRFESPNVSWSDVGGMQEVKKMLEQSLVWPLKNPEAFERMGIAPPKGLLMYGPPGCSKTLIAKATACRTGLNFISVKGPELLSKWVGESEKAVRDLFRKARQANPCIVFFDELDALGGARSSATSSSGVGERVLAQLLTEIDGVEQLKDVFILGATNRPDLVDPALTRPGRLDRLVYVPLPDEESRTEIFRVHLRKTPVDSDCSFEELASQTSGYSGAEIAAVCHEAVLIALSEDINAQLVRRDHLQNALTVIQPRIRRDDLLVYDRYHKKS